MTKFKWIRIRFVAGLALGMFLLPEVGLAEYYNGGYNASRVASDIGKAESVLNPASDRLSSSVRAGKNGDRESFQQDISERVKKAEELLTKSEEERQLRDKVGKWREQIDKLKVASALPGILDLKVAERRAQKAQELKGLFSQLQQAPSSINPNDLNLSGLEASCRNGVDFSQFKKLAEDLGSQPFQYLRQQGQQLLAEQDKQVKKDKLATLQKLAAEFDKLSQEEIREDVGQGGSVLDEGRDVEDRIADLQRIGTLQKQKIGELRRNLVKSVFTDFIPKLSQIEENDERIAQLANHFADNLEAFRKASYDAAVASAQQLRQNCLKLADQLGRDNPMAPNTLFNAAYQWVVSYHNGNADFYANRQFLAGVQQVSQKLDCRDTSAQIDATFGSGLQNAINQLRTAQDPNTLLQGAMSTLQAVGNAQAQVGQAIRPLMEDCQYAARNVKKIKNFIQGVQQAQQQLQAQQPTGRPGVGGGPGVRSLRAGSGQQNPLTHRAGSAPR